MHRLSVAAVVLGTLLVACGGDEGEGGGAGGPGPTTTTTAVEAGPLPGERVELYPYAGARLAVVGVAAGDRLNVRSGPGPDFDVVFELEPTAMTATATGHNRSVGEEGFWSEIAVDGRNGWANTAFLLQPGQVSDVTAALFPASADRPEAKTLAELAMAVGRLRAGEDPELDIVVVDEVPGPDGGEVTVDVVGFGDDATGGERLTIAATGSRDGDSFTVRAVEATTFCRRGVTDDRLCV